MATYKTAASADDANETLLGAVSITDDGAANTNTKLDGTRHVGVRTAGVVIAQGATISSATLNFDQLANYSGINAAANTSIYGNKVANAASYSTATNDVTGRVRTTASVAITGINGTGSASPLYNVAAIVQEIVNQATWVSGNAMAFMFIGSGVVSTDFIQPYMWDYAGGFYFCNLIVTVAGGATFIARPNPRIMTQSVSRASNF